MSRFWQNFKRSLLGAPIRFLARAARYSARVFALLDYQITGGKGDDAGHKTAVIESTVSHDMYGDPDEKYYREQYWHWIARFLPEIHDPIRSVVAFDLGCGQGRLTTRLCDYLKKNGRVIGVDISRQAINLARKYSEEQKIENAEYRICTISEALSPAASGSVDIVVMTEVTFFHPDWRSDLEEVKRVLRPGGIACIGFRPQYYDALCIVRGGMLEQSHMLLEQRRGNLYGGNVEFTWQTSSEIRKLFMEELEMNLLALSGIGCCSGIQEDPHASIVRPSMLDEHGRRDLMNLELSLGMALPDAGRYMLAIASKGQ